MSSPSVAYPAPRQTVYKRKRTANFTVLGNAVLFDARLDLDECAAIVKLLAKPHDWQVHPLALRREWGVGREKFYRIVNKLIRLGYIARGEMIKDAWGRFIACEYIVTDEPEAPPEEIDAEAIDESETDDGDAPETPPLTENATGVASLPHAGFRDAGEPHAENQHTEKELRNIQTKTPLTPHGNGTTGTAGINPAQAGHADPPNRQVVRLHTTAPPPEPRDRGLARGSGDSTIERWSPDGGDVPLFEQFVLDYRPEKHMSIEGARRRWLRMTDAARTDALRFLEAFRADRQKRGWKMPDMRRYLMDQHWVPYAKAAVEKPTQAAIKPYSAQWHRWRAYRIATGQPISFMEDYPKRFSGPWYEPSEWPPPLPPKEHRTTAADNDQQQDGDDNGT